MLAILMLACTDDPPVESPDPPDPADPSTADTSVPTVDDSAAATGDTAPPTVPCTGVEAIFFDLGETLVTWDGDLFQPIPGASETIEALKVAGYRVGIITNTSPGWDEQDLRDLLANPGILDLFEVVLMSSLASSPPKPSPAIFAEAHALMVGGPPIGQTAFVTEETEDLADGPTAPTEGARAAGMFGVLVLDDDPSPLADATIPDLSSIIGAEWLGCP